MGVETILAIIAACAIIAAAMMSALAYRMNEQWTSHCEKINREWYELYKKMVDMNAEAADADNIPAGRRVELKEDEDNEVQSWR